MPSRFAQAEALTCKWQHRYLRFLIRLNEIGILKVKSLKPAKNRGSNPSHLARHLTIISNKHLRNNDL